MEELEILASQSDLKVLLYNLEYYNAKISENYPHRKDLIGKMVESIETVKESLSIGFKMKIINKQLEKMNHEWSLKYYEALKINNEMAKELEVNKANVDYLEQLEKENEELKKKVELLMNEL